MIEVTLVRSAYRIDGTFGNVYVDKFPVCLSLERPWKDNQRGISCIPTGHRICSRVNSHKFGNTFEVVNVPGRSDILWHGGNIDDDSHGCIIVGTGFIRWTDGSLAVRDSNAALSRFLAYFVNTNEFSLEITNSAKVFS